MQRGVAVKIKHNVSVSTKEILTVEEFADAVCLLIAGKRSKEIAEELMKGEKA